MKPTKLKSPLTLGDFEVLAGPDGQPTVIGRGSFGVVYCAVDRRSGEEVALKVLNEHVSGDEKAVARFKEETREHKRLNHPGIVSIQDSGDFGNKLYYSMEFCRGGDLAGYSKSQGPLDPIPALKIIQQVADALVYASGHYLLHRDIKPGNILLVTPPVPGQLPKVKLTDFGLSKISVDLDSIKRPQMSLLGGFHGTLQYASPEQVMEDPLDVRSDIFSLGLTLWHILVGAYPLGSQKEHELINDRIDDRSYRDRFPVDWPPAIASLLGRMLEKKPENRFRDFGELTRVLENCIELLASGHGSRQIEPAKGRAAPLKEYFTQIDRKKKRPLGILHTARMLPTDGIGDPSPCHFLLLESNLDEGTMEALRTVVDNISRNPHPNIAGLDWQETLDGLTLVIHSPPDGQTLLNTIRKEGKHALSSVHHLLEQAASANDHARSLGIELNAHPRDINLLFDFTGTRLLFTVSLPGDDAHDAGPTGGTIAGTMMGEGSAASGDCALMDFATLLYWMVSARMPVSAAYVNPNAFKAIEGLAETGNNLIRDALCRKWDGTCLEFFTAICREEGLPLPKTGTLQVAPSVSRPLSAPKAPSLQSGGGLISIGKPPDSSSKPSSVLPASQYPSRTGSLANSRSGGLFARQREQKQREIEEKQRQLEEERRKLEQEQEKAALMEAYLQDVEQDFEEQLKVEREQMEETFKQQLLEKEEETNRLREAAERAEQEKAAMMESYLKDVEKDLAEQHDLERQQLEVTFQQQLREKEEETARLRLAAARAEQERLEALRLAEQKEAERLAALERANSNSLLSHEDSESLKNAREEALRLRQEAEAERILAAEKLRQAEEEAARKAEEAVRKAEEAAAEAKRKAEAEAVEAKRLAEEEARQVREAAEAERRAAAEQLRQAEKEAERKAVEAKRKAEEEAAEKLRQAQEEAERRAIEARQKAEKEAAEKLRQAEKEAERRAIEARQKAEKEAAEARRKAEAEAKALREQAAKEKERAKKEAEKILAAAREGKPKPFLPLPALVALGVVLLVGGFFAIRSLPMFQEKTPPPPPPITDNKGSETVVTPLVAPPPVAPAPKTWYSTWKLVDTVGKMVTPIQPSGGHVTLAMDGRATIIIEDGESPPGSLEVQDDGGKFPISGLNWKERETSDVVELRPPPNIEFRLESPISGDMQEKYGQCILQLKDSNEESGGSARFFEVHGGIAKGRVGLGTKYNVSAGFSKLLFGKQQFIPILASPPIKSESGAFELRPVTVELSEGAIEPVRIRVPDSLEPEKLMLQGRIKCALEPLQKGKKADLPFQLADGRKVTSHECEVDYERDLQIHCIPNARKIREYGATVRANHPIYHAIFEKFMGELPRFQTIPDDQVASRPDEEKRGMVMWTKLEHYRGEAAKKRPETMTLVPSGSLDGKILFTYFAGGETYFAWRQKEDLITTIPLRLTQAELDNDWNPGQPYDGLGMEVEFRLNVLDNVDGTLHYHLKK